MGHLPFPHPRISRWPIRPMLPASVAAHHRIVIVTVVLAASPAIAIARTWHVPGDAPTIQAAIDSSQTADDVLVAPGTYLEHNIVMKGGIRVHSEQGPGGTTIDAQNLGRGFTCTDLHEETSIEGFTIMNGRATGPGGGIRAVRADLLIQDCVITACFTPVEGGGVYVEESTMEIKDCEIRNNRGEGSVEVGGGGVACINADLDIESSVIAECITSSSGGGVDGEHSTIELTDCEIVQNRSWFGGGVSSESATQLTLERCVISRNIGQCFGGGIYCDGTFALVGCLIARNSSPWCGDGIALRLEGTGRIVSCTVVSHVLWPGSWLFQLGGSDVSFERNIVAFNPYGDLFSCPSLGVTFRCCDIYGNDSDEICGEDLGGNFSADPLFCDAANGNYTLDGESPCLPGNHPQGVDCGLIGAHDHGCGVLPPTGACCFADGSCLLLEETVCVDQLGTYMGDEIPCETEPCEPTPVRSTTWGKIKATFRDATR